MDARGKIVVKYRGTGRGEKPRETKDNADKRRETTNEGPENAIDMELKRAKSSRIFQQEPTGKKGELKKGEGYCRPLERGKTKARKETAGKEKDRGVSTERISKNHEKPGNHGPLNGAQPLVKEGGKGCEKLT